MKLERSWATDGVELYRSSWGRNGWSRVQSREMWFRVSTWSLQYRQMGVVVLVMEFRDARVSMEFRDARVAKTWFVFENLTSLDQTKSFGLVLNFGFQIKQNISRSMVKCLDGMFAKLPTWTNFSKGKKDSMKTSVPFSLSKILNISMFSHQKLKMTFHSFWGGWDTSQVTNMR